MKKYVVVLSAAVVLLIGAFCTGSWGVGQDAAGGAQMALPVDLAGPDFCFLTAKSTAGGIAAAADPNISLYFFPQDSDRITTVLRIANTSSTRAQAQLWLYRVDGAPIRALGIIVPPGEAKMLYSNPVANVFPSPYAALVDFSLTSPVAYAELVLPPGFVLDGYVVWHAAGVYDTQVPAPTVPLRFTEAPPR